MSNEQILVIYNALLVRSANGKLKRNMTKEVAYLVLVSLDIVQCIWKRSKNTRAMQLASIVS